MMIQAIGSNYFFEKANHPAFVTNADVIYIYSIVKEQAIISQITIDKTIKRLVIKEKISIYRWMNLSRDLGK